MNYYVFLAALKQVASDKKIETVYIEISDIRFSWAEVYDIDCILKEIQDQKKSICTFSESGNLKTLFLCSRGNYRYVSPGALFMSALPYAEPAYFSTFLKKLGLEMEVYNIGKYKSAGEMFSRTGPSGPALRNLKNILKQRRDFISERFSDLENSETGNSADRKGKSQKKPSSLSTAIKKHSYMEAELLIEAGFFHATRTHATFKNPEKFLPDTPEHSFHHNLVADERNIQQNHSNSHQETDAKPVSRKINKPGDLTYFQKKWKRQEFKLFRFKQQTLAFVSMEGMIIPGDKQSEPAGNIPAGYYRKLFEELMDSREEAVILYINSGGGSADASELLYQSIYQLSRKKPVIAILGGIAASGGIYIASGANYVFASPASLVGSIGVIRFRPNIKGLLNLISIKTHRINFDETTEVLSPTDTISKRSRVLIEKSLDKSYRLFLKRVAKQRQLSPEEVHESGQGQIFLGEDYFARGMIDGINSLTGIIDFYRERKNYKQNLRFNISIYPQVSVQLKSLLTPAAGNNATGQSIIQSMLSTLREKDSEDSELLQTYHIWSDWLACQTTKNHYLAPFNFSGLRIDRL